MVQIDKTVGQTDELVAAVVRRNVLPLRGYSQDGMFGYLVHFFLCQIMVFLGNDFGDIHLRNDFGHICAKDGFADALVR